MSKVTKQEIGKETFQGTQILELKKIEKRVSKLEKNFYMLYFNMCVKYDPDNIRNNIFLDIPFYASEEFMDYTFEGVEDLNQLKDKKYLITVDFEPRLEVTKEGLKYAKFIPSIISMILEPGT